MGILDIVLLLCFVPEIVLGLVKGFVKQAISLVSIVVGIWLASRFSGMLAEWVGKYFTVDPKILNVIVFVIVVILAILLLYWTGELLTKIIKVATLGWLNRLLGALFAIVKTAIILGLLILLFESLNSHFDIVSADKLDASKVYCVLRDSIGKIFPYLKSLVGIYNV